MQLIAVGLNHKTAPVEVREKFSIPKERVRGGLIALSDYETVQEAVVLSTCNRSEIYAVAEDTAGGVEALRDFWADLTGIDESMEPYLYCFVHEDAIRHLFRVASSLDSLVIGEGQILSQVKDAYAMSHDTGTTSTVLNTLFHRAIATGKRVRTETRIAFSAVSVSYAAVELAREIFGGSLDATSALIYGAGRMAELTIENLLGRGVKKIYVANHHRDKAEELADKYGGQAVDFDAALEEAADVGIVVTSTGAPHYVVHPKDVRRAMKKREGRSLVFFDIAVPRDVDPEVGEIAGVTVYNIDDLEEVVDEHREERQKEAHQAEGIVEEEVDSIMDKFRYLSFQPLMARLSQRADKIRRREVRRAMGKLPGLGESEQKVLDQMSKMIVRKLLRFPMMTISAAAGTEREAFYVDAMKRLFKLDYLGEAETLGEESDRHRYAGE
ncbi:MAG: glutamyl-tRNA reductase [Schwartzia sp.]|nr:glutamyl-tRNA reductase [Schwartzia sp. (in: firmicutes)]